MFKMESWDIISSKIVMKNDGIFSIEFLRNIG